MKSSFGTVVVGMLVLACSNIMAFQPQQQQQHRHYVQVPCSVLMAKKKSSSSSSSGSKAAKGFGTETSSSSVTKKKTSSSSSFGSTSFSPMATKPEPTVLQGTPALPNTVLEQSDRTAENPLTSMSSSSSATSSATNQGQVALERLRREQAEKKDAELRRVKEILDTDKLLQTTPAAAAIPEKVAMRMGQRMLPFVGIPLFGSMSAFVAFWYFATYKNIEFEPGMVAATTIVILASGLLVRFGTPLVSL